MQTQDLYDPTDFLYNVRSNPFPGYQPEAAFGHGTDVVVARIPASHWSGCTAVISETRLPASFYSAIVTDRNGRRLKFSTGSGDEAVKLLNKICLGLADGTVQLTPTARAYHSLGVGIGWSRVTLCFEDIMFMATVANEIRTDMLGVQKLN